MDNLIGIKFGDWRELLQENRFAIDPGRRSSAARLTLGSLFASARSKTESQRFDSQVAATPLAAPIFVIGHWRSGTTLLHNLLAQDDQFAYPRIYQVSNPHTFLSIPVDLLKARNGNRQRKRAMDNIEFDPFSPAEDEFAMCPMSLRSDMIGWSFLRRQAHYDRYLTFRDAPAEDYQRWRKSFLWFSKKVTFLYGGRRLILKSPQHTARVRLLLQEFPDARFIHIHRNPYAVYRSTEHLYRTGILPAAFQKTPPDDFVVEGILRRYKLMYDAFFEDRTLIPAGQYVEVNFDELERNMMQEMACLYEQLNLTGYSAFEPKLRAYVESLGGYQKNKHPDIPDATRRQIYATWRRAFDEWSYPA